MVSTDKPARPSAVAKSSKTDVQIPEVGVQIPNVTRREFLFYIWGASLALSMAGTGGALYWFMKPRFRAGEFGGIFPDEPAPQADADPLNNPSGKFWLTYPSSEGIVALYKVCTHLGCLYAWVANNNRFECPCHGSKYELNGKWIEGPAPRSLDRFVITVQFDNGSSATTNENGDPVPVPSGATPTSISVDTGTRIKRAGRV